MEFVNKAKNAAKNNVVLLLSIGICLFLFILGGSISGSAKKQYQAVYDQLTKVNNQITQTSTTNQEVVYEYETTSLEGGLDKKRWAADDIIITEWIYPAFNFTSSDEYNSNRDIFVGRLGANDDFVINIMPPYITGYTSTNNESAEVSNGSSLNMSVTDFKSYVSKIDGDNYSYLAVVSCSSTSSTGTKGTSDIVITYTITGDGSVTNFHAATPSTSMTSS